MVNILIPTKPDDMHAIYAKLALDKKGHNGEIWYTADFPEQQAHSFQIKNNEIDWRATGIDFNVINNHFYDVVWLRRPRKPVLPESLHPDDRENAKNENATLFQTFWQVIAPKALWVNSIEAARSVNSKLLQLKVASQVGLTIPDTLISNNPKHIKDFINSHQKGTIYKTLHPTFWITSEEYRLTYTNEVNSDLLPMDSVLQSTPGIFQSKIRKAYELRVTYFGDRHIAVKLNSQEHPKGVMDWRFVPTHELHIEEYQLPHHINQQCLALMKQFNIVFACFDFIVTPDKQYYFLEVNEQGQFLWIEEVNPSIKMLDAFCEFLINPNSSNEKKESLSPVSLSDFTELAENFKKKAIILHKDPGTLY